MNNGIFSKLIVRIILLSLAGIFIIGSTIYLSYLYSQRQSNNLILPGGVTYLGPSEKKNEGQTQSPSTNPVRFTAPNTDNWKTHRGKIYPYSFSYPSSLPLVIFPDDTTDSVAISWNNIPPQINILLNMELIEKRDPKFMKQTKLEYVKNWYRFFSGLKGLAKVDQFTNINGLKGYKAIYINTLNQTPNVDIFFEVPTSSDKLIHLANGILDPSIFERLVDSLKWSPIANASSSGN